MADEYIPLHVAAARSGLHPESLRRLLKRGVLTGYQARTRGRPWFVSVRSLRMYVDPVEGFALDQPGPKGFLTRNRADEDQFRSSP